MKTRDTLILLGIVVALGLFIWFWEKHQPTTGERKEREDRILSTFDREKVTRISIEKDGRKAVLERTPEKKGKDGKVEAPAEWNMVSPAKAKADEASVDAILSDLEYMESKRKVLDASGDQRKSFGLMKPTLACEVTQGGDLVRFVLGSPSEAGGIYLAIDGDSAVHVVDETSLESLNRDLGELREKYLLGKGLAVSEVSVRSGGTSFSLSKKGAAWTVTAGDGGQRASTEATDRYMEALEGLRALRYVADGVTEADLAARGFPADSTRIDYARADGKKGSIIFGGPCKESGEEASFMALATASSTLACIGQAARDALVVQPGDLRLLSPAEFDDYDAFSVEVKRAGSLLVRLEKDENGQWSLTAPGSKRPADKDTVEALLSALVKKRASSLQPLPPDASPVGLGRPAAFDVTVMDIASGKLADVTVGTDPAGKVAFQRRGESFYGTLEPEPALSGADRPYAYYVRKVVERDYFDAVSLEVTGPISHRLVKDAEESKWKFESPADLPADAADARDTVETLAGLTAKAFVADTSPSSLALYGLDRPEWTIAVGFEVKKDEAGEEGGNADGGAKAGGAVGEVVRLLVGKEIEGGRAAILEGGVVDAVMVIEPDVFHRLTRPLADKGSIAATLVGAATVTLAKAGGSETFSVAGGKIDAHVGGKEGLFTIEAARTLFQKLASLRADRVVGYGPPPSSAGIASPVLTLTVPVAGGAPDAAAQKKITFGAAFEPDSTDLVHARTSDVDATFGVEASLLP